MADAKMIEYRVDNGIAVLEINRPPVNSYTTELLKELDATILDARFDDNVHAIVITGKVEKFFSAGADINMLSKQSLGFKNNFALHGHEVLMRLENTPKIVIAAINGHAVGVGITMTLQWDIRLAAEGAKLAFAFVRRGVIPEALSTWILPRLVGASTAAELLLSGRTLTAREALEHGIVSRVVPAAELLPTAMAVASDIARNTAPVSVAITKRLLWRHLGEEQLRAAEALERQLFDWCGSQPDAREGVRAFLEKRQPQWSMRPSRDLPEVLRKKPL